MKIFWGVVGWIAKFIPAKTYKSVALAWLDKKTDEKPKPPTPPGRFIDTGPGNRLGRKQTPKRRN